MTFDKIFETSFGRPKKNVEMGTEDEWRRCAAFLVENGIRRGKKARKRGKKTKKRGKKRVVNALSTIRSEKMVNNTPCFHKVEVLRDERSTKKSITNYTCWSVNLEILYRFVFGFFRNTGFENEICPREEVWNVKIKNHEENKNQNKVQGANLNISCSRRTNGPWNQVLEQHWELLLDGAAAWRSATL